MTQDQAPSESTAHASLQRKRFLAKLLVFAAIVAFALLKPKVEAWLDGQNNPNVADSPAAADADRPAGPGDVDLGTLTITENDAESDADLPGEIVLTTTDPARSVSPQSKDGLRLDRKIVLPETKSTGRATTSSKSSNVDAGSSKRNPNRDTSAPSSASRSTPAAEKSTSPKSTSTSSKSTSPRQSTSTKKKSPPVKEPDPPGKLTLVRGTRDEFRSTAGLMYVRGSVDGHRLKHVLKHAKDNLDKPVHGVYSGDRDQILAWIDEAYMKGQKRGKGVRVESQGDRIVYTVDLGEKIGYVGGQVGERKGNPPCRYLRLVVQEDNEVVTAYPSQSL